MNVFRINFGPTNEHAELARRNQAILLYEDPNVLDARRGGDVEVLRSTLRRNAQRYEGRAVADRVLTRWVNHYPIFTSSQGDLWLNRDEDSKFLWWAISADGHEERGTVTGTSSTGLERTSTCIWKRTVSGWSNRSRAGRLLDLRSVVHPFGLRFIAKMGTFDRINEDDAGYFRALIDGDDVSAFHERSEWSALARKRGWAPRLDPIPWAVSIRDMWEWAKSAEGQSGQESIKIAKVKEVRLSRVDFDRAVRELLQRNPTCAYTGIQLHEHIDPALKHLWVSLDRIDSDGHYEVDNIQLVCRFVNRLKSDLKDEEFREYIRLIREGH